ncbi:MAG: hypothetical protein ACX936_05260, partial [Marinobacter sp.]
PVRRRIRALPPEPGQPQACVPSCFFLSSLRYSLLLFFKQNRTRLDDFRLDNSRYYVFFLIFSPASIVDKTSFINQSAAVLVPFFYQSRGTA